MSPLIETSPRSFAEAYGVSAGAEAKTIKRVRLECAPTKTVNFGFLEQLVGYNARRASLAAMKAFMPRMAKYGLRPVNFSVLTLILANPGITSRQLCATLRILPPNVAAIVNGLLKRDLIERERHPLDGRAVSLHLTMAGRKLVRDAKRTASQLESEVAARLSQREAATLIRLLKKCYQ